MRNRSVRFAVLNRYQDVISFVEQVVAAADQSKSALGFFAASVFREFALSEQLYVATETHGGRVAYAGQLMFKCSSAKASVLQMFVVPSCRKHGVATMLLDHLKSALTELLIRPVEV